MTSPQGKYWCFTYNNPTLTMDEMGDALCDAGRSFHYFSVEVGASGTRHYQGYVEFSKLKRLSQLKRINPAIHWERRAGTQQQALDYCKGLSAGKTPPQEWHEGGTLSETSQGRRNDIHAAVDTLRERGIVAVAQEHPAELVKYHRGFTVLQQFISLPKPIPEVHLCFGPPDSGKTRRFFDSKPEDFWWRMPISDGLWFDRYHGQRWALIDDFDGRCNKTSLRTLLELLDRYPVDVQVKGAFTAWVPEVIYITTNLHPRDWYDWSDREQQWPSLVRRFTYVHWYRVKEDPRPPRTLSRPDANLSDDVDVDTTWEHFWDGPQLAQLGLDQGSGRLVSNAPASKYDW